MHAESNGNNGVEIVKIHIAPHLAGAFGLNYSEFPKSCPNRNFPMFVKIRQMLVNCRDTHFKKRGHELLAKPNGLILHADFDALFPGLCGEDQKFCSAVSYLDFFGLWHGERKLEVRSMKEEV